MKNQQIINGGISNSDVRNTNYKVSYMDDTKDCLNTENNSKCCFFKVANVFLLFAVFLLAVILCIYAPRVINGNSLGFDYIGVIVGIFALLVTLLVAWNIWQAIDTKRAVEDVVVLRTQFNTLCHEIDILHEMHEAFVLDIFGEDNRRNGRSHLAFDYFMRSAYIFMRDMEHYDRRFMSAISSMRTSFQDLWRPLMGPRDSEMNQFIQRKDNIISNLEELQRRTRGLGRFAEQAEHEITELIDGIRNLHPHQNYYDKDEDNN